MGPHLAIQTIHPGHTQTPSLMEPHGLSFGDTNHETRPQQAPSPMGAGVAPAHLSGLVLVFAFPRAQVQVLGCPSSQATPRPQALWEQVWCQPSLVGLRWFSPSQGPRFKPLAAHRPRPHPPGKTMLEKRCLKNNVCKRCLKSMLENGVWKRCLKTMFEIEV